MAINTWVIAKGDLFTRRARSVLIADPLSLGLMFLIATRGINFHYSLGGRMP